MVRGVNRFNYLPDVRTQRFPNFAVRVAIDNRIRGPLATLGAILFVSAGLSTVQLARLHAAQHTSAVIAARLAASADSLAAIRCLRVRVHAARRMSEQLADMRRVSIAHANELAWIGNHLPSETWLSALHYENGAYSLEGTSSRVAAIGNAILALQVGGRAGEPRLLSLHEDAARPGHVMYSLRLEPHR